jgi:hypothetical protein
MLGDWGVPLAVLGMLLATLFLAALLNRYQAHQAAVRAAVRRLESGLLQIQGALERLADVPLSRELRVTLRSEVLARYQRIQRLYRRYPDIGRRISDAEKALNAQGPTAGSGVGPIENEQVFRGMHQSMKELISVIEHGDTLQPIPRDVRVIFRRELGERHAEVMARFHLVAAQRLEKEDRLSRARAHLTTLMHLLRTRCPATPFVRELFSETEHMLTQLGGNRRAPDAADDAQRGAA